MNVESGRSARAQFGRLGAKAPERREFQRVKCALPGRFMGSDSVEHRCIASDVSMETITVEAARLFAPGEKVVAYIEHLGRVEGDVVRVLEQGFAFSLSLTKRRADKLAEVIAWLGATAVERVSDRRGAPRARSRAEAILTGRDGGGYQVISILDRSETGIAFRAQGVSAGERVLIDGRKAVVLRVFDGRAAASFI